MRQYWLMYLLRGLGISELPKIFHHTFQKKFFTPQFYTLYRFKSSKKAKKHENLQYRRKSEKNSSTRLKTGEIGRKTDAKIDTVGKKLAFSG